MLGGTPALNPGLSAPPEDVREKLRNDIGEEEKDVEGYTELAHLADKAGMAAFKMKMEEQAADEANHAEQMRRLLG